MTVSGEVLHISIGQAGAQITSALWDLYTKEHGIGYDGKAVGDLNGNYSTIFQETQKGSFVPRSLFFDSDSAALDILRSDKAKGLFRPDWISSTIEGSASTYARGRYVLGPDKIEEAVNSIRKVTECCGELKGIVIVRGMGGGTGSGLGSGIIEELANEFKKPTKLEYAIYPSPGLATGVVEPYNSALAANASNGHVDCSFIVDNQALYRMADRKLDIPEAKFDVLNNIVTQGISGLSASMRFPGKLNMDMNDFHTNLIPFPRLQYPIISLAPLSKSISHSMHNSYSITKEAYSGSNSLLTCDTTQGDYMASALVYRGSFSLQEVNAAIARCKDSKVVTLLDWCPTGFKVALSPEHIHTVAGSPFKSVDQFACVYSNHTAIRQSWSSLKRKYDLMFRRRAFVHWFVGQGMEEGELLEARESLDDLEEQYEEVSKSNAVEY
ncbi:hypothetical protein CANCADRAFT_31774 [Tortispora caseinolytica NRRL Y-17796]|uniref:Tubulin alpha chain n=1 Tax=Tortispora caseinolytica NRRL Y-17796 TaxID=767744 RepID=A0A1E4TGS5_9ASCO|nr:hypothetical protein CANCADRAFT_31774 [Tortispora caseinolytica NRRL Y-17796]